MKQEKAAQTTAPATFESVWASFAELRQLQKEFAAAAEVRFKEDRAHSKEIEEAALRRSQEDRARSKEIEEAALRRSQEDRAHSKEIEEAADKRLKKLEASLNKVNKMVGDTANNNGFFAEEHFFNELEASHRFGNIRYDFVLRNENRREGKLENEYDILMLNGSSVAIIEIKYRA
ncbi:MAG: hypothetical protein LBS63_02205, partial [Prevotellaceae bacterium]|nr:hypothetical protein [Prevotellaceae bacterium]